MANESKPSGFFHTLPGILTATAGVIAAITALIAALHQAGLISPPRAEKETPAAAAGSEPAASEAKVASASVVPAQVPPTAPVQLAAPEPEPRTPAAKGAPARPLVTPIRARANPSRPSAAQDNLQPQQPPQNVPVVHAVPEYPAPAAAPLQAPARAAALLCRDANYGGICRRVPTHRNLIGTVIDNDTISSLRLGSCAAVKVCTNIDLDGTCETFTNDEPDLSVTAVGDDSVSSIQCIPATQEARPAGEAPAP